MVWVGRERRGVANSNFYYSNDLSRIMLIDMDSIKNAFPIEDISQKMDPKMRELYFSAIASLKVQLRHNRNKW